MLEIAMIRVNHNGTKMDAEDYNTSRSGQRERSNHAREAGPHRGMGVISISWRRRRIHQARGPPGGDEVRIQ
jgi:hypothetical protein